MTLNRRFRCHVKCIYYKVNLLERYSIMVHVLKHSGGVGKANALITETLHQILFPLQKDSESKPERYTRIIR